ncbi:MAG: hypothetical protein MI717_01405 [Spirochaetales bacterium]|nr:hypothetical protein [Spirochaetales bacterium]
MKPTIAKPVWRDQSTNGYDLKKTTWHDVDDADFARYLMIHHHQVSAEDIAKIKSHERIEKFWGKAPRTPQLHRKLQNNEIRKPVNGKVYAAGRDVFSTEPIKKKILSSKQKRLLTFPHYLGSP